MLEVQRLVEAVEQSLPSPEHDRRDRDRQFLHVPCAQRLTDHVSPAHHVHVLVAGRLARPSDRLNSAPGGTSSSRWVTVKNGTPNGLWPPQASAASNVLRPPTMAPTRPKASSRSSLSAPVASPLGSSS